MFLSSFIVVLRVFSGNEPPLSGQGPRVALQWADPMDKLEERQLVELGVSARFAREHGWVVNAVTGWLSAYFMEDPRFRLNRRYEELETGTYVWVCEITGDLSMTRLIKRLLKDLPPGRVQERGIVGPGSIRYLIDTTEELPESK